METGLSLDVRFAARDALSPSSNIDSAKAAYDQSRAGIRDVAEKFESMFLSQMFGHMFKGIKTDGLTGGGNGEAIFRDMLVQEYGNQVSKAGGIGLSSSIERQLIALQEGK
ncbi:MAG: rod-binding protein [Proteobacteria bacterium]|nr:rod-binding protein [Pseudomonadota bacterium]MDA1310848.1 rod-binding protein [Pseudomonadota bacterium]